MPCTEAYKEHIMYTFNGFCKTVIRFAALNAWRDRSRRRQKEVSLEYLTYEEYPITICGQTVILTNGELAAALLSLPEYDRVSNPQDAKTPAKENGGAFTWGILCAHFWHFEKSPVLCRAKGDALQGIAFYSTSCKAS